MDSRIVAIIGSADEHRTYDPELRDPEGARKAAEQLGQELAEEGCKIIVYSCDSKYIEGDFVRGYVKSGKAIEKGIIVYYPSGSGADGFPERSNYGNLFDYRADTSDDWEVAFYYSLREAHAFIVLGGGRSTFIAGLLAITNRTPMLAIPQFGGNARKVWQSLTPERDLPTQEEISLMGQDTWNEEEEMAQKCVKALMSQIERKQKELESSRKSKESRFLVGCSIISAMLFIMTIGVLSFGIIFGNKGDRSLIPLLLLLGALAGSSGSATDYLWKWRDMDLGNAIRRMALGFLAGGVSAILFIIAQITTNPDLLGLADNGKFQGNLQGLFGFAMLIGFVAGFTYDRVFGKLSKMDALKPETLVSTQSVSQEEPERTYAGESH